MQKDIKIGNKLVPMKATAATPFRFKDEFGGDMLREFANMEKSGSMDGVFVSRVAYIMARTAAAPAEFPGLYEWLEQFELIEMYEAFPEIVGLWNRSELTTSTPKKK